MSKVFCPMYDNQRKEQQYLSKSKDMVPHNPTTDKIEG